MHKAWLPFVGLAGLTVTMNIVSQPVADLSNSSVTVSATRQATSVLTVDRDGVTGVELLLELEAYLDPVFGFELAIPYGWTPVVVADDDVNMTMLEPGYAVGFESPQEHAGDVFSDYLMVEIMPGDDSGVFETNENARRVVTVDGRVGWRDELTLPAESDGTPAVDLIVRQASISGLGFTIGLYAIGEPSRRALLDDAFEVMLRTFSLPVLPYDIS